ncbi:hypothetical protein QTI66_38385 [Variovorax sp. J22R133]|uniref:hypothetical protein n=1 Tax=Variovorax brevis TaxID=3053503 RepID=UPI0025758300|nr:hypothetical protein [Variovorax sp. J22R133]MDM0117959.1 hypothetical protein [Variovorax sp. J22R133]
MNCEATHCFDTATVRFVIHPDGFDGPRVLAEITEDALRDAFGARGGPDGLLDACKRHFEFIAATAVQHHRLSPSRAVRLDTTDLAELGAFAEPF